MDVNQILAKAMSTSSEEEAIACLRMARKRGGQVGSQVDTFNRHDAKYWYEKALDYYTIAKKVEEYYRMYTKERDSKRELENEVRLLKAKIENHNAKWDYVIPIIGALTMAGVIFIGILSKG